MSSRRVELADQRFVKVEVMDHAQIHLRVERQVVRVRKAAAQPATHNAVEGEGGLTQLVGTAERSGHALVVIEVYPMIADVSEFAGIKIELRRVDVLALRTAERDVHVGRDIVLLIVAGKFDAINTAILIVERCENQRSSELTFVQQVRRFL